MFLFYVCKGVRGPKGPYCSMSVVYCDNIMYITTFCCSNGEHSVQELLRRRSASVLEVKEHAHSRLREELLRAQQVSVFDRRDVYQKDNERLACSACAIHLV